MAFCQRGLKFLQKILPTGVGAPARRAAGPGGDTWGHLPYERRAGGDTWITGSYDPVLNLTYWGVAQAKPWFAVSRGNSARNPALYTSSTIALNPDTGELQWYH